MHQTSGRWKLGLSLAVLTAACWGVLPVALAILLRTLDAFTLTEIRFVTAALGLGVILLAMGRLPPVRSISRQGWMMLLIALVGLVGNFVLYVVALTHASPTINQVVTQLSPLLLMLGGIVVFRERFTARQWAGLVLLLVGLPLFFNRRLPELLTMRSGLGFGVWLLVLASTIWSVYGLAQKYMLRKLQGQQILLLLYIGSAVVLAPLSHFSEVLRLDTLQWWLLAFACANTVVAYGAFAEALRHWEASRVGATLTLTPLFTMVTMWIVEHTAPTLVKPEQLNVISIAGALVVVGGSMLCALGNAGAASASPKTDSLQEKGARVATGASSG